MITWTMLEKKDVLDYDGFWTEYALYTDGKRFVCIFGDSELYQPSNSNYDFETENEEEAYEWFRAYDVVEDDYFEW